MKTYEIKKITGSAPDWAKIPTLSLDYRYIDTPEWAKAWAQICYGTDAIFVHLSVIDPVIRREETGTLGAPCLDSCLEFFISPSAGDNRYLNFEFNSNKCMFLGFGSGKTTLLRIIAEAEELFAPTVNFTADGWEIFYKIPEEFVRRFFPDFALKAGKIIRANCYKCMEGTEPGHFLSWSPVVADDFTFHTPECFGEMIFSE